MNFEAKYALPCFAVCKECRECGIIIFKDGSVSRLITSQEEGKHCVEIFLKKGVLTKEDADRIEDHIVLSEMPLKNPGKATPANSSLPILLAGIIIAHEIEEILET